jgi:hypothetical protein
VLDVGLRRAGEGALALQAPARRRLTVRSASAILKLVGARARRRPARWLLTALGIALATAFAGAIAGESTIAGDRAARASLRGVGAVDRPVRVTWQGVVTPAVQLRARALLHGLGLGGVTEVVLMGPVRLSGVIVRPAAIAPLDRWVSAGSRLLGPCRAASCPMLLTGGSLSGRTLTADGVRVPVIGTTRILSAAPLGFTPGQPRGQPPVVVTGDPVGLEGLGGLGGVSRTHSWLAPLAIGRLHSWQLSDTERRLQQAQSALLSSNSSFDLAAPFAALEAARAQADAAPRRLLLAGGGALAALALFVVLAVGGLRRDVHAELGRLEAAGARAGQSVSFVLAEAGLLCGAAMVAGATIAAGVVALLAAAAGAPPGDVLAHSLLTVSGAVALLAGWVGATALVSVLLLASAGRIGDTLAAAAVAGLVLALWRAGGTGGAAGTGGTGGTGGGSGDPLPVLLAPLCCLAAGVLVYRGASALLRAGERVARRGPVLARLAFVGLARSPAAPSLAIAFIAVSIGLGAFALSYRATLLRGAADQAADRVPLDATVSAGPDFTTPLEVATAARWRALAGGSVSPVRRTDASYVSGGSSVTVPALGVPASALTSIHGWRASDGSASVAALGRRLVPSGPVRSRGPQIPGAARMLAVRVSSPSISVTVTAVLRDRLGSFRRVVLGRSDPDLPHTRMLGAPLPHTGGPFELDGLELNEPTGLEVTNGHQNAENAAAATQFAATVRIGPVSATGASRRVLVRAGVVGWRGAGAASAARVGRPGTGLTVRFATSGLTGLLRPPQPSDARPVPVLVDPQTATIAGHSGRLALTVDGLPVAGHVVGVLRRFPTIPSDAAGFIVADQQTLSSALDAQSPGQGRTDELWISTSAPASLRATLARGEFAQLVGSFRVDAERGLRSAPVARAVLGTLVGASVLAAALAVVGLLVALLGAGRDERIERDLIAQGIGPRGVRRELRIRLMLAAVLGVAVGLAIGVILTRLAVATVRAAGTVAVPRPPLVTVAPWGELALWSLVALAALGAAAWVATRSIVGRTAG